MWSIALLFLLIPVSDTNDDPYLKSTKNIGDLVDSGVMRTGQMMGKQKWADCRE